MKELIEKFIEEHCKVKCGTWDKDARKDLHALLTKVAGEQRRAASLWIEDSNILDMPLITDQL